MRAMTLMVQGTASSVGKSLMVAAICRILKQDGLRVAPFKSQNMALNSFVTCEGGEIGRAQAVQAEAAGIEPSIDMNPILIKPETNTRAQIVVRGKPAMTLEAGDYYKHTMSLLGTVRDSLDRLRSSYEAIIIEGAGSPAEVNFRKTEIVNMRVAKLAGSPVVLVGDIDRGGVFASLVGTLALLQPAERNYMKGFIINKFRGDATFLQPAIDILERRTRRPVLGVVPFLDRLMIAQEDSVYLDERSQPASGVDLDIAIARLPHTSNYDDFDPLEADGCSVRYVSTGLELGAPDLMIIPGTKSTVSDLSFLRKTGLADGIIAEARKGTPVVGICGGYQILGRTIRDASGVESMESTVLGLGLLDVETEFAAEKSTVQVRARVNPCAGLLQGMQGLEIIGYEIHMGQTAGALVHSPFTIVETPAGAADHPDGAMDGGGTILGTYIHGLFDSPSFREAFLNNVRRRKGLPERSSGASLDRQREYDRLADVVRRNVNISELHAILKRGL